MAEPTTFRARYTEVELINRGKELVTVRLIGGDDLTMSVDAFESFYVPIHSTTVDLTEMTAV